MMIVIGLHMDVINELRICASTVDVKKNRKVIKLSTCMPPIISLVLNAVFRVDLQNLRGERNFQNSWADNGRTAPEWSIKQS